MSMFVKGMITQLLGISCWMAGLPVQAQSLDRTVVIVNDVAITEREVAERIVLVQRYQSKENSLSRAEIVKNLVTEALLLQVAQRNGIDLNSREVNQAVESVIRSGEVPPELTDDKEALKKQIAIQTVRQGIISGASLLATEDEITEQMQNLPNQLKQTSPIQYHLETLLIPIPAKKSAFLVGGWKLFHIATRWRRGSNQSHPPTMDMARQQAQQALIKAKHGMSFQQLAAEHPGQLSWKVEDEWRTADKLPAVYLKVLADLTPGDVAGPFQWDNGFHLIRLQEASGPIVVQARHILLKGKNADSDQIKQQLEAIRQDCLRGEKDFPKQAAQYSEDPNTVFRGGDLGWVLPGTLDKAFDELFIALKPGEISSPFKTSDGWHLVQLTHKQFLTPDHPEWKRYVATRLIEQRKAMAAVENVQNELYASAHIQWIDPTLKPVV